MTDPVTHDALVIVAARWLRNRRRCGVVLTEHHGGTLEIPDAIGWYGSHSIQVECKVSKADFRADAKKAGRRFDASTGEYRQASERWYLAPVGLLNLDLVTGDWGLLEWGGRQGQHRQAGYASPPHRSGLEKRGHPPISRVAPLSGAGVEVSNGGRVGPDWSAEAMTLIGWIVSVGAAIGVALGAIAAGLLLVKEVIDRIEQRGVRRGQDWSRQQLRHASWWFSEDIVTQALIADLAEMNEGEARDLWRQRRLQASRDAGSRTR